MKYASLISIHETTAQVQYFSDNFRFYALKFQEIYVCYIADHSGLAKAWTVFACSNTGIVGSNPTQGLDICLRLFCVRVGSGLVTGWSPIQGALLTVID
jgi:hypothetical protein